MPVVFNEDPDTAQTPLRDLLQFIPGVLERAAPERVEEFNELYGRLAWRFEANVEDGKYGFAADTLENPERHAIYVPMAALERTWAYVYAYRTLFNVSRQHPGVEITREHSQEVGEAFALLNWATKGESLKERSEWPAALPSPDGQNITPEQLEKTNEMFLGVLAFILLHEVAHIECGHTKVKRPLPEEKQRGERQADRWAEKWLLDRVTEYSTDEKYRINRCNWVMLALSILNLVEYHNRNGLPTSHPPTLERVLDFSAEFCPESSEDVAPLSDFPLLLALTVIDCQALNLKSMNACKPSGR
jgi:hypothetical protein